MKTYQVKIWQTWYDTFEVQAETEEQAQAIAEKMWQDGDVDAEYPDDSGVDVIQELA